MALVALLSFGDYYYYSSRTFRSSTQSHDEDLLYEKR
jgi:hypothetical protein